MTIRRPRPRDVRITTAGTSRSVSSDSSMKSSADPLRRHAHRAAGRDHLEAVPLARQRVDHRVKGGDRDGLEELVVGARGLVRARAALGGADARALDGGADPAADVRDFHTLIVSRRSPSLRSRDIDRHQAAEQRNHAAARRIPRGPASPRRPRRPDTGESTPGCSGRYRDRGAGPSRAPIRRSSGSRDTRRGRAAAPDGRSRATAGDRRAEGRGRSRRAPAR